MPTSPKAPAASAFRRASLIFPQPIAIACGRVLRARTQTDRLDACLRAGEVLARYLAAVAVSSFASREGGDALKVSVLRGNLAFGHFLSTVQQVANVEVSHPAAPYLAAGFKPKRGQTHGVTYSAIESILNLRNNHHHQLQASNENVARALLEEHRPDEHLAAALKGVEGLLCLPLFIIEEQLLAQRVIRARRLLLMGESADPAPDEIELSDSVDDNSLPYLAINATVLKLSPFLAWGFIQQRADMRLLFLDKVNPPGAAFKTVDGDEVASAPGCAADVAALCEGGKRPGERVELRDGRNLAREWGERRQLIEETGARGEGLIPWESFDAETMNWYASRLTPKPNSIPAEAIRERLLDGRTSVNAHERRQLVLLFGTDAAVREELRRDLLDLQVITDPEKRWDERDPVERGNLIKALRRAVDFLARHLQSAGLTVEGLTDTTGKPDYIAIREALVNQFIHQDYTDQTACARIIIRPDRTSLANPGHSLVDAAKLEEGGTSQARNPLVARALKLIGFAENAGSGLRLLYGAWRGAGRPRPVIESNRDANTFTLTLDWRPAADPPDDLSPRVGVRLTSSQAAALRLVHAHPGATLESLSETAGTTPDALRADLDFLQFQQLLRCENGCYSVAELMRDRL